MATRRNFLTATAVALAIGPIRSAFAESSDKQAAGKDGHADFLFVQSAKHMTFDKSTGRLVLEGVSPVTLFFSDRPQRIAGNMTTVAFVPFWSHGKDSFLSDPPNADVSVVEGDELRQTVAVLRQPELSGDTLTYKAEVLKGDMPANGNDVSVFIDVIGMPLTPLSFAGAARRAYRRAYWRRGFYWR